MSFLRHLTPGPLRRRYADIIERLQKMDDLRDSVRALELAVDALILNPTYSPGDHVGFNGQLFRKRIFTDIASLGVDAIVETGTSLGDTAAFMAQSSGRPVYSSEVSPRLHAIAKMRLAGVNNVDLRLSDSRRFLRELADELVDKRIFFYLDAHWYRSLPLREEVEWITAQWERYVVMIDDFQVPDDPGYGYDNYGPGRALAPELLQAIIDARDLVVFFPAARSEAETGRRRGCVVLAPRGESSEGLSRLDSLRLPTGGDLSAG